MNKKNQAILYMIISTFSFSLMSLFVKLAGDINVFQKAIFRAFIVFLIAYLIIKKKNIKFHIKTGRKWLLLRSTFGTVGILLNYYALDHLIMSDSAIIFKLSTPFIIIISFLLFKEKVNYKQALSIVMAFFGTILVIKPSFDFDTIPFVIALLGAMFAALAHSMLRPLGKLLHPLVVVAFFSAFTTITLTPLVILNIEEMTIMQFIYCSLAGLFAMGGQYFLTISYGNAMAKDVSIYSYYSIVFASIYSIFIFHEIPDVMSILGYLVIFASSYYMYKIRDKKK